MLNLHIDAIYPTVIIICISVNPIEPFLNWLCIITKMLPGRLVKDKVINKDIKEQVMDGHSLLGIFKKENILLMLITEGMLWHVFSEHNFT